jgi:Uma2 family endonuclease
VKVEASGLNTFPDASIVCGQPRFNSEKRITLLNPGAIFEVLSEGTEAYDRGEKFWNYRHMPSLKTFVLISTNQARVEVFELGEGDQWQLTTFDGFEAILRLKHYDIEISLADVYDKTDLDPSTPPNEEEG